MCEMAKPANVVVTAAGVDPEEARRERTRQARAQKAVTRELQRTLRFLSRGEMREFDALGLLGRVGAHLSLQFPAEQQNDTKEFMDKLLDRVSYTSQFKTTLCDSFLCDNFYSVWPPSSRLSWATLWRRTSWRTRLGRPRWRPRCGSTTASWWTAGAPPPPPSRSASRCARGLRLPHRLSDPP